jgi:hypothetical protein
LIFDFDARGPKVGSYRLEVIVLMFGQLAGRGPARLLLA